MNDLKGLGLAIHVHSELSKIVYPATPNSIRYSQIKNNKTLLSIIFAGIISFIIFVYPFIVQGLPDFFQILGAAGLGITFHSLYTANSFLHNSTFDPRYNQKYIINFALGLLAGAILGLFGKDIFVNADSARTSFNLTSNLLALVGGFSAEAVAQILQRIAETLVTLVRGSSKENIKMEAEQQINNEKYDLAQKLTALIDQKDELVKEDLKGILTKLLSKKVK